MESPDSIGSMSNRAEALANQMEAERAGFGGRQNRLTRFVTAHFASCPTSQSASQVPLLDSLEDLHKDLDGLCQDLKQAKRGYHSSKVKDRQDLEAIHEKRVEVHKLLGQVRKIEAKVYGSRLQDSHQFRELKAGAKELEQLLYVLSELEGGPLAESRESFMVILAATEKLGRFENLSQIDRVDIESAVEDLKQALEKEENKEAFLLAQEALEVVPIAAMLVGEGNEKVLALKSRAEIHLKSLTPEKAVRLTYSGRRQLVRHLMKNRDVSVRQRLVFEAHLGVGLCVRQVMRCADFFKSNAVGGRISPELRQHHFAMLEGAIPESIRDSYEAKVQAELRPIERDLLDPLEEYGIPLAEIDLEKFAMTMTEKIDRPERFGGKESVGRERYKAEVPLQIHEALDAKKVQYFQPTRDHKDHKAGL